MSDPRPTQTRAAVAGKPAARRVDRFLELLNDRGASDLHFAVGRPPTLRLAGHIEPVRYRTLSESDFTAYLGEVTPPAKWEQFKAGHDIDFAYEVEGLSRFRVSLYQQLRGSGAVFRTIPWRIPSLDQLGLPDVVYQLAQVTAGLVLVTGPSGSGKSTTLAALVSEINAHRAGHIISIEEPVEFVHRGVKAFVTQQEVGVHAASYAEALRNALREDPDVIVVGELRDADTIRMALSAAGMGILVFGSLNTNSSRKAIERVVNIFDPEEQPGMRANLADVLRGTIAQQLVARQGGGRVPAVEVLVATGALAQLIRDGKTHQVTDVIQRGKAHGMIEMDEALLRLVREKTVAPEEAYARAIDRKELRKRMRVELNLTVAGVEDDEELTKAGG